MNIGFFGKILRGVCVCKYIYIERESFRINRMKRFFFFGSRGFGFNYECCCVNVEIL